jgi:GNAT superfamily N-acetyltransferase
MPTIPIKTYYLEMDQNPCFDLSKTPENVIVKEWNPDVYQYKKLYTEVGNPWGWSGRLTMSANELSKLLQTTNTKLYIIEYNSEIAGFVELSTKEDSVEIKYFGLLPHFVGKGFGGYFLKWSINKAWKFSQQKVTVHTCEFDHPSALSIYQKYEFKIKKEQIDNEFYSDEFLRNRL